MKELKSENTTYLIDGSSFLYRAYYSMRPIHTLQGEPVQAVYVFCRMIKKIVDACGPRRIAVVWDSKGPTVRHEMYKEYKANRQAPPSDLFEQKEKILEFGKLINLGQVSKQGVEADDLMYSIAKDEQKKGRNAVVITSDKDLFQVLSENIFVFDPFKESFIDREKFIEKMAFEVEKLPFYFSLLGDSSDNIPGVSGIGKKGALELVQQFKTLEDLYNNIESVDKKRLKTALEANRENAFLSQKLFLLHYYNLNVSDQELEFDLSKWDNAKDFFAKLGFKSLLANVKGGKEAAENHQVPLLVESDKYEFKLVSKAKQLRALAALLKKSGGFAIDVETTGLRPLQDELVGISVAADEKTAYYIPIRHKTEEAQLPQEEVLNLLKPILEDPKIEKYLHNAKFDQLVLYHSDCVPTIFGQCGIEFKGKIFDTLLAASLVVQSGQRIGLKHLSESIFNERMLSFDDVMKKGKYKDFSYVPLELATSYGASDALQTYKLKKYFEPMLIEKKQEKLFFDVEIPTSAVLFDMEKEGIILDSGMLKSLDEKVTKELEVLKRKIAAYLNEAELTTNLNSPRQVEDLLFNKLGLPTQKKSSGRTGYSTDVEVLKVLAKINPIPGMILQHRGLQKLKNTYIDALPGFINPETKKIHSTFSQITTSTGRLSSFEPNLQNIPISTVYGKEVRAAFVPEAGNVFVSADYSQIELRVLAYLTQDESLVKAFLNNCDIHTETATGLFDVQPNEVTTEQRQIAKRINFSILYGLTPYGLA
ncbi:DNA polymerase I, partial [bacterium]|nr:DNA polymerase I [bacterium]